MKFYKKIISLAIIYILLLLNVQYIINAKTPITTEKSFKAAVFIRSLDNYLLTDIKKASRILRKISIIKLILASLTQNGTKAFKMNILKNRLMKTMTFS